MANKIYVAPESAVTFAPSGGTEPFTVTSLGAGAGRISDQLDRGTGSHAAWYKWRCRTRMVSAPSIGAAIYVYVITSDGTYLDGDFGVSDAAITTLTLLNNVTQVGSIIMDEASSTKDMVRSGLIWVPDRYISVAWWNATAVALSGTAADHEMKLIPMPTEVQ